MLDNNHEKSLKLNKKNQLPEAQLDFTMFNFVAFYFYSINFLKGGDYEAIACGLKLPQQWAWKYC